MTKYFMIPTLTEEEFNKALHSSVDDDVLELGFVRKLDSELTETDRAYIIHMKGMGKRKFVCGNQGTGYDSSHK